MIKHENGIAHKNKISLFVNLFPTRQVVIGSYENAEGVALFAHCEAEQNSPLVDLKL